MNYASRVYVTSASEETIAKIEEKYSADSSASLSVEIGDKGVSLDIYEIKNDTVRFLDKKGKLINLENDGAYVCRRLADEYNLKAGSAFNVSPYGTDKEYTLTVKEVICSSTESISITKEYAAACGISGYKVDSLYTREAKNSLQNDELTKNFEIQDKQSIVESFETFTSLLNVSVTVLITAAIVLGVVVLYNLGVMSYTERYREMATLKVVGFKDKKIARLLIGAEHVGNGDRRSVGLAACCGNAELSRERAGFRIRNARGDGLENFCDQHGFNVCRVAYRQLVCVEEE